MIVNEGNSKEIYKKKKKSKIKRRDTLPLLTLFVHD